MDVKAMIVQRQRIVARKKRMVMIGMRKKRWLWLEEVESCSRSKERRELMYA